MADNDLVMSIQEQRARQDKLRRRVLGPHGWWVGKYPYYCSMHAACSHPDRDISYMMVGQLLVDGVVDACHVFSSAYAPEAQWTSTEEIL